MKQNCLLATVLLFILFIGSLGAQPCSGPNDPCTVCGVSATITSINGGTVDNGVSNIPGVIQAGASGMGGAPLEVTANSCGEINLTVELDFLWDQGIEINWIHGISFDNSPGWSAADGILPGPGWLFQNSITGVCSGVTYGAGFYYDPPGTDPNDDGNSSDYNGTECIDGGAGIDESNSPWLIDGDPSDNWGDNCDSDCPTFGFNLTYCPINGGIANETISFFLTEDGETGAWFSSDQCVFLLQFAIKYCDKFSLNNIF